MGLSIGVVGLPNVGKSTLFNALTKNSALVANYPFATIEPNTGIVPVPDDRLKKLSELYGGAPIKPATVTFVDIAGLVAGASEGEGLGNKFLANIRECDAILHVVRSFDGSDVTRSSESANPRNDIDIVNTELMLADLQTIDKNLPKLAKEVKANPKLKPTLTQLETIRRAIENSDIAAIQENITGLDSKSETYKYLKSLQLLSIKPVIYVFNVDENGTADNIRQAELSKLVTPSQSLLVNAQLEAEIKDMDENDAQEMLESYGQAESGLKQIINASYQTLGLQSFLTAGEKEVRAWTINKGAKAPQAAGVIHKDFERGFIAAEIVNYDDLIGCGSLAAAKSAGKIRTEGKNYVMREGDVVEFRFNVSK